MHNRRITVLWTAFLSAALLLGFFPSNAIGQTTPENPPDLPEMIDTSDTQIELIADPNTSDLRVDAPREFLLAADRAPTSDLQVNYIAAGSTLNGNTCQTFPNEARTAFEYAASIWESLLVSNVPIKINACWAPLPTGVLGSSGPTYLSLINSRYVVAALANAMLGYDTNSSVADMSITYSSNFASNFYYGTDQNTPFNQYDFASIVLHEIAHGLGFIGMYYWNGSQVVGSSYPYAYDMFTRDGSGTYIRTLTNPALTSTLVGGSAYFDGPNARAANGGDWAKLYTPSPWRSGSSYSHLDEIFNGTENALMTYSISNGESVHNPGPVTMGIFKDIGWNPLPTAPSSVSAVSASSQQINLSWSDNSADETGFEIYRSTDNNNWTLITTVSANSTGYTNSGLTKGTTYYYRVRTVKNTTYSEFSPTTSAVTFAKPLAPSGLTLAAASQTQINLTWVDNSLEETGFEVWRSPNGSSGWVKITTTAANTTRYTNTGLNKSTSYYYKIIAASSSGPSDASAIVGTSTWDQTFSVFLPAVKR